jgi:hypothetical protein
MARVRKKLPPRRKIRGWSDANARNGSKRKFKRTQ